MMWKRLHVFRPNQMQAPDRARRHRRFSGSCWWIDGIPARIESGPEKPTRFALILLAQTVRFAGRQASVRVFQKTWLADHRGRTQRHDAAAIPIAAVEIGLDGVDEMRLANAVRHREQHRSNRIGWLRAAVLGANDGIVSTASLIVGVASAASSRQEIFVAGVAGLVAGALSMAAGEYVSVSSQADTERADLDRERRELATQPAAEEDELTAIYVRRGLEASLARQVARQLMAKDALLAHARDELGLTEEQAARPLQAAFASAGTFAVGAMIPILAIVVVPPSVMVVSAISLVCLIALGAIAARTGGASAIVGAARVGFWGALAMALTAGVGRVFGAAVA